MPATLPYTHYACPCTNVFEDTSFERTLLHQTQNDEDEDEADATLNPANPRTNHVLFPLENLLFCNECHQIRCPRCYYEEVLYYYCPNCLMETAPTSVKTETNRCTRSCLQCPICSSALQPQSLAEQNANSASTQFKEGKQGSSRENGPFFLSCPYCAWSTLEAGLKFDKITNFTSQLAKLQAEKRQVVTAEEEDQNHDLGALSSDKTQFEGLRDFYRDNLIDANPAGSVPGLGSSFGVDSPSHLSRILTQYGIGGLKKQRQKPMPMREAASMSEGFDMPAMSLEDELVARMKDLQWDETASVDQQEQQLPALGSLGPHKHATFADNLWPTPIKLRSRRSKRCAECRYHLLRPDDKRQSARYKLRLVAVNHVPRITATPLNAETTKPEALKPGVPQQFLLTCRNPLYDPLRVRFATPSTIGGAAGSRITILCPQFDVGASADVWDEALSSSKPSDAEGTASRGTAEAGKVWKKGRNWTSVVLEVIPGFTEVGSHQVGHGEQRLLEIPIHVRIEYHTDASAVAPPHVASPDTSPGWKSAKEEKIPQELEFWTVVGLGRLANTNVS